MQSIEYAPEADDPQVPTQLSEISIKELLALPGLAGTTVLAGHRGLDRSVRHITVLEVPPPIDWLRGGELVLTTFYCVHDDPAAQELVMQAMSQADAAGIGFHRGHFKAGVPPRIFDLANDLELPLLHIPDHLNYIDVIDPVMMEILSQQSPEPHIIRYIRMELMRQVRADASLQELIERFVKEVSAPVFILDQGGQIIARASHYNDPGETQIVIAALPTLQKVMDDVGHELRSGFLDEMEPEIHAGFVSTRTDHDLYYVPILLDRNIVGLIVSVHRHRGTFPVLRRNLYRELSLAATLVILRQRENADTKRRLEEDFVDLLLRVQPTTEFMLLDRAARLGWDLRDRAYVVACDVVLYEHTNPSRYQPSDDRKRVVLRDLRWAMTAIDPSSLVVEANDHILYLPGIEYDTPTEQAKERITRLISDAQYVMRRSMPDGVVSAIVGEPVRRVADLRRSYERALYGRTLRQQFNINTSVLFSDQLVPYDALYRLAELPEIHQLHEMFIGPLIAYDDAHGTDLVETLIVFVQEGRHVQSTASALGVHINTVRKRLDRIAEICQSELGTIDQSTLLDLCVRLHGIIRGSSSTLRGVHQSVMLNH